MLNLCGFESVFEPLFYDILLFKAFLRALHTNRRWPYFKIYVGLTLNLYFVFLA